MLSSPSFGSHHLCSDSILPKRRTGRWCGRFVKSPSHPFRFRFARKFNHSLTRIHVRLLGPCFKTGHTKPFSSTSKNRKGMHLYTPIWQRLALLSQMQFISNSGGSFCTPWCNAAATPLLIVSSARHLKFKETYKPPRSRFYGLPREPCSLLSLTSIAHADTSSIGITRDEPNRSRTRRPILPPDLSHRFGMVPF